MIIILIIWLILRKEWDSSFFTENIFKKRYALM